MKPDAPGLLSTITGLPVALPTSWPSERASWSVALPAAKGTTNVICLSGYSAGANDAPNARMTPPTTRPLCQRDAISVLLHDSLPERAQGAGGMAGRHRSSRCADQQAFGQSILRQQIILQYPAQRQIELACGILGKHVALRDEAVQHGRRLVVERGKGRIPLFQ